VSTILNGTVNVLESVRDVDSVDRFAYTSSSMIYGDFQYRPADEEHPTNPKGVYGGTKLGGEVITRSFSNQYDIEHVIVRPSAVYGPTDANRRVSQIFVERALNGEPLELHGGGTQKLDFTFVEDTAQGFALAALEDNAANETFNITRGEGRSIRELAEVVGSHVGGVETIETEARMSRPKRGALDIEKAQRLLGYEPQYSLEDGMEQYVQFVQEMGIVE
jgi:nucleoside-diphosphate-sugar epimerase